MLIAFSLNDLDALRRAAPSHVFARLSGRVVLRHVAPREYEHPARRPAAVLVALLESFGADVPDPDEREWVPMRCYGHADVNKSAAINHRLARYKCHSCGRAGNAAGLANLERQPSLTELDAEYGKWLDWLGSQISWRRGPAAASDEDFAHEGLLALVEIYRAHVPRWRAEGKADADLVKCVKRTVKSALRDNVALKPVRGLTKDVEVAQRAARGGTRVRGSAKS